MLADTSPLNNSLEETVNEDQRYTDTEMVNCPDMTYEIGLYLYLFSSSFKSSREKKGRVRFESGVECKPREMIVRRASSRSASAPGSWGLGRDRSEG